jgi:hypothetical protein
MAPDKAKKRSTKTGRKFEQLVEWIQRSVHKRAEISVNQKLEDIDTGKRRQIDITIRLSDGPTEFLGIVEVRDRRRPIGVRYVEEISSKRQSVRADAAFLVSRSGFTRTAITKARQHSIRALTYEEAQEADWSSWLQCRTFSVLHRKYDKPIVFLFEHGTDKAINISPKYIARFKKKQTSKIILDKHGTPLLSLPDLVNKVINIFGKKPYEDIAADGSRKRGRLLFQGRFEPSLWVKTEDTTIRQVGKVGIEADLYWQCKDYPLKLMRYREVDSTPSIAELATSEVEISGKKYRFEILAPGAGEYIPAGATVSFRSVPLAGDSGQDDGKNE